MPVRQIFPMANNFFQGMAQGICTVASLQYARRVLELGRGLGSFDELLLSPHQLNALMAVWRGYDDRPAAQSAAFHLIIVGGGDRPVRDALEMQRITNLTAPHVCIFWTVGHTMGYRVSTRHGRECEFFDIETGLWLADNDMDIRAQIIHDYAPVGMRVLQLAN